MCLTCCLLCLSWASYFVIVCINCSQGRVILLDSDDSPSVVTNVESFSDQLRTTVAALPAATAAESSVVSALASCRLICNIRNSSSGQVQHVYVTSLPMEPAMKWVCASYPQHLSVVVSILVLKSLALYHC